MPILLDDDTIVSSAASTHERPLGGVLGERAGCVGDKVLLSTTTVPKHAISVLPGGTTKLLPRLIGPFTVVEEDGDLHYRLTLPTYMKTHPAFYVGRLKRYVDPEEITYPHRSNENDGDVDCESSVVAVQATGKPNDFSYTRETTEDSEIEEDSAFDAGLSLPVAHVSTNGASVGRTPGDLSYSPHVDPKSDARLNSKYPPPLSSAQRSPPATERQQDRRPQKAERNRRSYRAPTVLVDAGGNTRFLVRELLGHRHMKKKLQILVQWKGYPKCFDSWEPINALRVDVSGMVANYEQKHQLHLLC
ncbi:unnamed protein product [Peronospora effusa]|nr:unnamed protein product [Peronospora effusa]